MINFFDDDTVKNLNEELSKDNVKTREGVAGAKLPYLPAHYVIAEANRIFGFGNWSTEVKKLTQAGISRYEKPAKKPGDKPIKMVSVSYLCSLKLTVKSDGRENSYEDIGFGDGVAADTAYGLSCSIELATKEAVTDSVKRCLRYYGDQFGLALYDKSAKLSTSAELEAAKIVTDKELKDLRSLYERRGIDDAWVLTALKPENYPHDQLELMRSDWYELAYSIVKSYKLAEIEKADYESDIDKVISMMKESANIGMLKALFQEAWMKTKKYDDKKRQADSVAIYEERKLYHENKIDGRV